MKPLVYYCRWQGASLRLRGRDDTAVWGQLVFSREDGEVLRPFHYNLKTWELTLDEGDAAQLIQLDEMGVTD